MEPRLLSGPKSGIVIVFCLVSLGFGDRIRIPNVGFFVGFLSFIPISDNFVGASPEMEDVCEAGRFAGGVGIGGGGGGGAGYFSDPD